jgi:2-dehydropantoate 2-reductase
MKITVVGAGGVGGYFGGRLALAGHDVGFVARGPHLDAIRAHGLRVRSTKGDFEAVVRASDDPAEIGPSDVVLFCVKSYDTDTAAAGLGSVLTADTTVVSFQNGIDNEEKLAAALGERHVIGGVAFIFSTITEPGVVTHTGGPASLAFGELDGTTSTRVERLRDACKDAGITCHVPDDIRVGLWTKFAFICATAGMTAATRLPLGEIRTCPESWEMFQQILAEVAALARAEGVAFDDDAIAQQVGFAESLEPSAYSSLHHDLVTGHRMELEALHGTVVARAGKLGVEVPANQAVLAILRPWAARQG